MKTYTVIGRTTGLELGDTVDAGMLDSEHPGLGGVDRLLTLGAIREANGKPQADDAPAAETEVEAEAEASNLDPDVPGTGKPLSYFDGKSEDEIRNDPDVAVGPARFKVIEKMRNERDGK